MRKVWFKIVNEILTPEQMDSRMEIYFDILKNIKKGPKLLERVITCDILPNCFLLYFQKIMVTSKSYSDEKCK